ncbi:hypothetical protein F4779DRAFT_615107 [Xylariaceae sp. FL0662B]|nr:hypothetical protein F4779DRAFT_615107 [Xylariaceae sp. FL0662B]
MAYNWSVFMDGLLASEAENPHRNKVVVCVVCGGICKPTVNSELHRFGFIPRDWMHPMLIKAEPGLVELAQSSTAAAYHCLGGAKIELLSVTKFCGGGPGGFKVRNLGKVSVNVSMDLAILPIHKACFDIANIFCDYQSQFRSNFRSPGGGEPSSIAHLYEIWAKRAIMTSAASCNGRAPLPPIIEPHGYFGTLKCDDLKEYVKTLEQKPDFRRFEANPIADCDTTRLVISWLRRIPADNTFPEPKLAELSTRILDLPSELHDRIVGSILPFENLNSWELACTRVMAPQWWRRMLFSGALIPWLFDLDLEKVMERKYDSRFMTADEIVTDIDNCDWELLCRQLAQKIAFDEYGILADAPPELWNRYRIWRLLSASRLGHLIGGMSTD